MNKIIKFLATALIFTIVPTSTSIALDQKNFTSIRKKYLERKKNKNTTNDYRVKSKLTNENNIEPKTNCFTSIRKKYLEKKKNKNTTNDYRIKLKLTNENDIEPKTKYFTNDYSNKKYANIKINNFSSKLKNTNINNNKNEKTITENLEERRKIHSPKINKKEVEEEKVTIPRKYKKAKESQTTRNRYNQNQDISIISNKDDLNDSMATIKDIVDCLNEEKTVDFGDYGYIKDMQNNNKLLDIVSPDENVIRYNNLVIDPKLTQVQKIGSSNIIISARYTVER